MKRRNRRERPSETAGSAVPDELDLDKDDADGKEIELDDGVFDEGAAGEPPTGVADRKLAPRRRPRGFRVPVTILAQDEQVLAVDKPAGYVSVRGRPDEPALAELLIERRLVGETEPFRVVHRLDREASGVILFARTLGAQQHLTAQFSARQVEKVYLALVQGYVAGDGVVELPIQADKSGSRARVAHVGGKEAVTRYRVVERVAGHTLLECQPLTGRLHQIRVHMAAIGHPLAVDPLYGGGPPVLLSRYKADYRSKRGQPERPLLARLGLHAQRITFLHPGTQARVTLEAPLPKELRATLNQLRRAGATSA